MTNMEHEILATSKENRIAPKLRPGEVMPSLPEGFVPTRLDGEIVFVSEPSVRDSFYGNSPYTKRQLHELDGIRNRRREQRAAVLEAEDIIYHARANAITYG